MNSLILGSTSPYRKQLLEQLGIQFITCKPTLDEEVEKHKHLDKKPIELAEILSKAKGQNILSELIIKNKDISSEHRDSNFKNLDTLIITGDQLVAFDNKILGKPYTYEKAIEHLESLSGRSHQLITAVTLTSITEVIHFNHVTYLKMKKLTHNEIINYVKLDQPTDCAGSYKIEKHGIALFESIECSDFSAIQGLPLIWLSNTLKGLGYELFKTTIN